MEVDLGQNLGCSAKEKKNIGFFSAKLPTESYDVLLFVEWVYFSKQCAAVG
jgi:hypothetical protein